MKAVAVVVTYNRLTLLKECLAALQAQTRPPDEIIVINNSSTDGTQGWLLQQPVQTITQQNGGGAFGFYTGIKQAYQNGADWIWLMDDDTIPSPTALEKLLKAAEAIPDTGFICSKVVWTDNSPHKMNMPEISSYVQEQPFNQYDQHGVQLIKSCTFVSVVIARESVKKVGLPLKDFFIWTDDHEYTDRIIRAGFLGFYMPASVAVHKTPSNHCSDIYKDEAKDIWKYRYGIRNELVYIRSRKGSFKFWRMVLKRIFIFPFRLWRKRRTSRWPMIKTVWKASIEAVSFHPKIEYID